MYPQKIPDYSPAKQSSKMHLLFWKGRLNVRAPGELTPDCSFVWVGATVSHTMGSCLKFRLVQDFPDPI
jgi:hypothetical protein